MDDSPRESRGRTNPEDINHRYAGRGANNEDADDGFNGLTVSLTCRFCLPS
jgi:hypothetical protein